MKIFQNYPLVFTLFLLAFFSFPKSVYSKTEATKSEAVSQVSEESVLTEKSLAKGSIFKHLNGSDWVVSFVLLLLVLLSILSWGLCLGKLYYLNKLKQQNRQFIHSFWKESSLKNLARSLEKYPYSPAKEVFRESYREFQRNTSIQNESLNLETLLGFTSSSLSCAIQNAKRIQRKNLENFLPFLAITASTAPFIGLFGTVWGIMNSFESIALTGNASLSAVAPGLSEALIATAFGLGAAIPSAIGYSLASHKIRSLFSELENFSQSFVNIIEKHLILSHKDKNASEAAPQE